jgi:AcrR family transcriptional regulator
VATDQDLKQRPKRDPEATKARLLDAAFVEFSRYGPAGARVERIVERAGVNPRMLYHYFGSKDGLWRELLAQKSAEMAARRRDASGSFADVIADVARQQFEDRDWARVLTWEALEYGDADIVLEQERSAAWLPAIRAIKTLQAAGQLPSELDPAQLQLSLIALATFPVAFPNTSKMVTGMEPLSGEFVAAREAAVRRLLEAVASAATRQK